MLLHPGRAVAFVDLALGFVGTARTFRTLQRKRRHLVFGILEFLRLSLGQRVLDGAVHEQVGISPDRRSEVRIGFQRQAEVTGIVRRVDRQALAAQHHRFQQGHVGTLADLLQQLGEIPWLHLAPGRQAQLEFLEELEQVGVLGFRRPVVHAVRRGNARAQQEPGGLHVGRDHAFLDQLVRIVPLQHAGLGDLTAIVQFEADFGRLELDRAALLARLGQQAIQLVQALDLRQQRADGLAGLGVALAHRLPHLVVGQACVRTHHRLVELRLGDFALAVDLHVADEAHAVHFRIQRADAVGQGLRQHGHHETREVHRRRTLLRLIVQWRAGTHVVRDIGDGHDQAIAAAVLHAQALAIALAIHRIVEVLRVGAVDGHQRHVAQVDAVADHRRLDHQRYRRRLVQHLLRELVRQVVAVDRGLHHQRRRQAVAQHGDDLADGRTTRIRRLGQLDHHQLAVARATGGVLRDLHVALDALVVGRHVGDADLEAETTDQPGDPAFQHARDAAFAAAAPVDAGDVGQRAVAMHDLAHFIGRQEQVIASAGVGPQEAETVRVGDHRAGDQRGVLHRRETAAPVLHQLSVADHRAQTLGQGLEAVGCLQAQRAGDLLGRLRSLGGLEETEDGFATGDGLVITLRFALRVRVDETPRRARGRGAARGRRRRLRPAAGRREVGHPGGKALPGLGGFARSLPGTLRARGASLAGAALAAVPCGFLGHASMVHPG